MSKQKLEIKLTPRGEIVKEALSLAGAIALLWAGIVLVCVL